MPSTELLLLLGLGYLLGSIPFGLILAKIAGKGDLRTMGSGNIGATNALRAGGKKLGGTVLLLDAIKGALAVAIAGSLGGDTAALVAAAGALVGHCYPVWLGFKGGKGVATLFGILIVLLPIAALVYAFVWVGLLAIVRISSLSGLTAAASAPATAFSVGAESPVILLLLGFTLLIFWKHRENIRRLVAGKEPRVGSKSRAETKEHDHRGSH